MIRVCGVTFDHTTNYGSCLQAYALQTAIDHMVIDNEVCEYALVPCGEIIKNARKKGKNTQSLMNRFRVIGLKAIRKYRRRQFEKFEKNNMHYVDCKTKNCLKLLNQQYDAFVCGSDVIWNLDFTYGEAIYFLNFAQKYKFSYAASFGVRDVYHDYQRWAGDRSPAEVFQEYLPELRQIGVREKDAIETVDKLINRQAIHVCDPVMLLTREQWDNVAGKNESKRKYIFAYTTYMSPNFKAFLNKLHKQTGLPIVNISWDLKTAVRRLSLAIPGPEKWIELLRGARYVVTNSFHATVFCCIYHKTFFCPMRDSQIIGTRIRLYDILNTLAVKGRIFGDTPEQIDLTPPDFSDVDNRINKFRERSLQFIQQNLKEALKEKQTKDD